VRGATLVQIIKGTKTNTPWPSGARCPASHRPEEKKELYVKLSRIILTAFAGTLFLSAGAFAQEKAKLSLAENVTVQGKTLKPGNYKLEWEGSGPIVQVSIIKGRDTIATVPATVVTEKDSNVVDAYGTRKAADGGELLEAFYPGGKKFALQLAPKESAGN
jgi:hypothetical protein